MFKRTRFLTLLLAISSLFPASQAFALITEQGLWVAGGATVWWFNRIDTRFIYMGGTNPPKADFYIPDGNKQIFTYDLGIGYDFDSFWNWSPVSYRLGLLYQTENGEKTKGKIRNSDQIDYVYAYNFTTQALFLDAQLDLFACQWLGPYIEVGLGAARNEISDYHESTLPGHIARVSPAFTSQSDYAFAYRLGVGMNYAFNLGGSVFRVSLAYVYQNNGTANSGDSSYYQINGQHLAQRLAGNQFEAILRYYIE